ncbi:hypothetical protein GCM10010230_22840 [Streptomyces narbonensis]|nr:hypothetical protein GCM10010230_22840 [Streptomyces narbonensis]
MRVRATAASQRLAPGSVPYCLGFTVSIVTRRSGPGEPSVRAAHPFVREISDRFQGARDAMRA